MKTDLKNISFKRILMCVYDIFAVNFSYILTQLLIDGDFNTQLAGIFLERALPVTAVFMLLFFTFRIYSSMWEYAGSKELVNIALASGMGGLTSIAIDIIMSSMGFAISKLENGCLSANVYIFGTLFVVALVGGMRIIYRAFRRKSRSIQYGLGNKKFDRVMIVGAGNMGMIMISELEANCFRRGKPIIAVDDDPSKQGQRIRNIPVKGTCNQIPELAEKHKIDTIILCLPSANMERQTEILRIAVETGCKLKTSPTLLEMADETDTKIRDVNISDLLSRPEVTLNPEVCSYITDQTILVTGGGGSIGSELCRQISKYNPKRIVVFDIYENNAFMLKNQLDSYHKGNPEVFVRIGSVRDADRLVEIFEEFHPTVVFHAAAHKHVPLMEDSPKEAVKNNVFGTYNVAETAIKYNVKRFVSISTDKAVNPANIMGATKRVTEMIIEYFQRKCSGSTIFAAVRFGNVLGSNGSVIPIFTEQIKEGGPVTVTHPEITRYFMTIPEASQLVAQAGGLAEGGEIFVLDMGEPVKIVSLAENLIRLSGYKPYTEIPIEFSGLRPGEKLYEELILEEENSERKLTANDKIFVTKLTAMNDDVFENNLKRLRSASETEIRGLLKEIVPNFVEQKEYETV